MGANVVLQKEITRRLNVLPVLLTAPTPHPEVSFDAGRMILYVTLGILGFLGLRSPPSPGI